MQYEESLAESLDGSATFRWVESNPIAESGGVDAPGNTSTTEVLAIGASVDGQITTLGDRDWVKVNLTGGTSYLFSLDKLGATPLGDPFLRLYNSTGQLVTFDDDGGDGQNSAVRFTPFANGVYYLGAGAFQDSSTGDYRLSAAAVSAQDPLKTIDWGTQLSSNHIKIYFAGVGETFDGFTATQAWSLSEQSSFLLAAQTWTKVANLDFTQVGSAAEATMVLVLDSTLDAVGRMTTPPGLPNVGVFDPTAPSWSAPGSLSVGGSEFQTFIHEIGHALGLAHPHDDGGSSEVLEGVTSEFGSYGVTKLNQGVFTVMSYNDGWPLGPSLGPLNYSAGYASGPMAMDIAVVQGKYGAVSNQAGDTVYDLGSVATQYLSIWDTGGIDTIIDTSGLIVTIDLRPATLQIGSAGFGGYVSYAGTTVSRGGYTIANGVIIENAISGAGDDHIIGNDADNVLDGGPGSDHIEAGGGNDLIIVSSGSDTIDGGSGVNTVDYSGNSTRISAWAGSNLFNIQNVIGGPFGDSIIGGVEANFFRGGPGDDEIYGNGGDDTLQGDDGNDTLKGGDGADTLLGLAGNDMIYPGAGNDFVDGGGGANTVSYFEESAGVVIDLRISGPQNTGGSGMDTLVNVANVYGSLFADIIIGNNAANTLFGYGPGDQVYGLGGDDNLSGAYMYGGAGNDTYSVAANLFSPEPIVFEGGDNPDLMAGVGDVDTIVSLGTFYWDYYSVAEIIRTEIYSLVSIPQFVELVGGKDVANKVIFGSDVTDLIITYGRNAVVDAGRGTDAISFNLYGLDESYRGSNTVVMRPASGIDYVYDFRSGVDHIDLSAFHFGITGDQVLAQAIDNYDAGTDTHYAYIFLTNAGFVNNFIVFMGMTANQLHGSDFIV